MNLDLLNKNSFALKLDYIFVHCISYSIFKKIRILNLRKLDSCMDLVIKIGSYKKFFGKMPISKLEQIKLVFQI